MEKSEIIEIVKSVIQESSPFYIDMEFWAVVIATLALILSLAPQLYKLFNPGKIELDFPPKIWITHHIGNSNVSIHLIIKNIGGRAISIKKIHLKIRKNGTDFLNISAQDYREVKKDGMSLMFRKFTLGINEEWNRDVQFYPPLNIEDSKKYMESDIALKAEIEKLRELEPNKNRYIAKESFAKPFYELFDKNFKWEAGNYDLEIFIETDNVKKNISRKFSFTLFESLINDFKSHKDDYSSGDRIWWYSNNYSGSMVDVEEKK